MSAAVVPFDQKAAWREGAASTRRIVPLSIEKRRELAEAVGLTFETAMARLDKYIEAAAAVGNYNAVASLFAMQLKMGALLVDRVEVDHSGGIDIFVALAAARVRLASPVVDAEAQDVIDVFKGA